MNEALLCRRDAANADADPSDAKPGSAQVERAVEASYPELDRCYQELVERVGLVQGSATVEFEIRPNGEVARSCAWETELRDQKFMVCVLGSFERLRFEAAGRPMTVRWPLHFGSDSQTQRKLSNGDERVFW